MKKLSLHRKNKTKKWILPALILGMLCSVVPEESLMAMELEEAVALMYEEGLPEEDLESGDYKFGFRDQAEDPYEGICYNTEKKQYEIAYTGSSLNPKVLVSGPQGALREGVDYTVTYDAKPKLDNNGFLYVVTVNGRGNYRGTKQMDYYVIPADISIAKEKGLLSAPDTIRVTPGSTVSPVIVYRGYTMMPEDLDYPKGAVYTSDSVLSVKGRGVYFTGTLEGINIEIISAADLKSQTIRTALKAEKHYYSGAPETLAVSTPENKGELTITAGGYETPLIEGTDFRIDYQNNLGVGTATAVIRGIGNYTGVVTRTFQIRPDTKSVIQAVLASPEEPIYWDKNGAKPAVTVTTDRGDFIEILEEGVDYTVTYSGNKRIGNAKYKVSFRGDFKGHKALDPQVFEVRKVPFGEAEVVCADMLYKNPGKYRSKPYVSVNGQLLGTSEYTLRYFDGETELKNADKITLEAGEDAKEITVKVTGKNHYDSDAEALGTYRVLRIPSGGIDMTKAKIVAAKKSPKNKDVAVGNQEYTAFPILPEIRVMVKNGSSWVDLPESSYTVEAVNNVNKGTAKLVVTGDGTTAAGSKVGNFTIVAKDLALIKSE